MAMSESFRESGGSDEVIVLRDICCYCANNGSIEPATHFCWDCGVFGRYLCATCLRNHNVFVGYHDVNYIGSQSNLRKKLQDQITEERNKLTAKEAEVSKIKKELAEMEKMYKNKGEEIDLLQERHKLANEELQQRYQAEIQERHRYERMYEEEKAAKDEALRSHRKENEDKKKLQEEITEARNKLTATEAETGEYKKKLVEVETICKKKEKDIDLLQERFKRANEELQQRCQTEAQQRQRYERMYQEEKAAKDDALQSHRKVDENQKKLQDQITEERNELIAKEAEVAKLKMELAEMETICKKKEEDIVLLQESHRKVNEDQKKLQDEITDGRDKLTATEAEAAKYKKELAEMETVCKKTTEETERLQERNKHSGKMASRYHQQVESCWSSQALKSTEYRSLYDHDTDMLLVHAKAATEAAKIMKKEQKNITRKMQMTRSKKLPKCKENYEKGLVDIGETNKKIGNIITQGGFAEPKKVKDESFAVNERVIKARTRLSEGILAGQAQTQQKQCMLCLIKETKIKDLQEKLNSSEKKRKENEEHDQKRYHRSLSWNEPSKGNKRSILEEDTFDRRNRECMKCVSNETKIRKLEGNLESLKQVCQANDEFEQRYQAERQKCERYERMYQEEKAAKDDALRRLSSLASSKLRDNNPNITDLSEQNRPTKIAEKMSELYDNEWTTAYDVLESTQMEETQIIQTLLGTFMTAYHECSRLATENFFERVQRSIEFPVEIELQVILPDQLKQQVKEFRKSRAPKVVKEIEKVVKKRIRTANQQLEEIQLYISRCIEIGWLCAVQDPPLVLKAEASDRFDTNTFKDYTKRGKYTQYVVWPALYLHDKGAQLAKGFAQGSDYPQASINKSTPIRTSPQDKENQHHYGSTNPREKRNPKQNTPAQSWSPRDGRTDLHTSKGQTIHGHSKGQGQPHLGQTDHGRHWGGGFNTDL